MMMKNKVELLAPAGNYEAFLGALNAGADAVYLGGEKFGARAYADNFTTEEICKAIHTAHFMGRRIYLTVNTLLKEREFDDLTPYLQPFYEAGLDGVIIQDIGVLCHIRKHFPELALHASTQMTLTGAEGCAFLKEQGVERVVPARELSLQEIREIKMKTGLEIECFIHGSMCYCYSGQCLFSSVLGGRSGNRGRCAQPCRLPYQIGGRTCENDDVEYPLSLKDMCTIAYLPELIEAGIDSFKIEGRMKKPEYAAGVTALYRKYIDLYYREGREKYQVSQADLDRLQRLYIRSEIQNGYYERHNGREMITLHNPGYAGSDEAVLEHIKSEYLREPDREPVAMKVSLETGKAAVLQIAGEKASITVQGAVVAKAQKAPLLQEDVQKRFRKTGNSCLTVSTLELQMPDHVFLPVKALNELRRQGVETYEEQAVINQGFPAARKYSNYSSTESVNKTATVSSASPVFFTRHENTTVSESYRQRTDDAQGRIPYRDILVTTYEQLEEVVLHECRRIYIESDLYLAKHRDVINCISRNPNPEYYLALPYVLRAQDMDYRELLTRQLAKDRSKADSGSFRADGAGSSGNDNNTGRISGFLVRNYESAAFVCALKEPYAMVPDAGLYCFNAASVRFWADYACEYTLPYELNRKEAVNLIHHTESLGMSAAMIVYGRMPMMISANCIRKTSGDCAGSRDTGHLMFLKDRYEVTFPVEINCMHCYNIIYNSVPTSYHLQENVVQRIGADIERFHFTVETAEECHKILLGKEFPFSSYTTGHLKRGVE